MPWNENCFGLEGILGSDDMLSPYFTIVWNMCLQVIDQEWLSETIFVVSIWHSSEIKSHCCSRFNITELVHTSCCVCIGVEELGSSGIKLWEEWVFSSWIPFLIVIDDVVSSWCEKFAQTFMCKNGIKNINFIDSWFGTFVSDSSKKSHSWSGEMQFPDGSLRCHQETESSISTKSSGPSVVWSVESVGNLIKIISKSHSILPVVILEKVVAILESIWITVSLSCFKSISTSNASLKVKVISVKGTAWLESLIVPSWVGCLSETSFTWLFSFNLCSEASSLNANHGSVESCFSKIRLHHFLFLIFN